MGVRSRTGGRAGLKMRSKEGATKLERKREKERKKEKTEGNGGEDAGKGQPC